ncbi:MAG: single-stranded-DNA-specific exonuclease RecJ [Alphaproteobacteria bacterium]|nr:single-stranded-DNA-specific exonuclease RecJ [Alphaproteobacteria bacterium]
MSETAPAVLGVERSAGGRRWRSREGDARLGLALAQRHGLPEVVGRIMAARGIGLEDAAVWLDPTLKALLPDPSHLKDMDRAAERVARAVRSGETIAIFGDYDVDGATSTALLLRFLDSVGGRIVTYIPDRITEGYGPNAPALLALRQRGAAVAVTVDCGITAFEPLEVAAEAGLEVVVVDHHVAEPRLPRAHAVVNPNRLDDESSHGQMAAVGVAFLLAVAINRALRDAGWYTGRPEPDLRQWLDLVALGTVCDVVPLTGVNRAFVAQGLKVMAQRGNPGIAALADVARMGEAPEAWHAGFLLGPRVNAGGRVGEAGLGAALLSAPDYATALPLAQRLDAWNTERKGIEAACLEEAIAQVEANSLQDGLVYAASEGWHPGVIGIVAGRLKERYNRPACVVALADGSGRGSGRSVSGVDLGSAVIAARQEGLLINGGGHAMAAGFTVAADRQGDFRVFLAGRIIAQTGPAGPVAELGLDGTLQPRGATVELAASLQRLAPFGAGNREPRFAIPAARVVKADIVGEDHVRCILAGEDGGRLKAIAFRAAGRPLGQLLMQSGGLPVHIAGQLRLDRWQGRESVQMIIDDAAPVT